MAEWNKKGVVFNRKGEEGGFTWNSRNYIKVLQMNDGLFVSDNLVKLLAFFVLSDSTNISDTMENYALFDKVQDNFAMSEEDMSLQILFAIADSFGAKDELSDFVVLAFLEEKVNLLEDLKTFAQILTNDSINVEEITSLQAMLDLMQEFGFDELKQEVEVFIGEHDEFGLTDHDVRPAVSDFLIGRINDDDGAMDHFYPFNTLVDWRTTTIQVMPPVENVEIEFPGCDGSVIAGTTYRDRLFKIVSYSSDGLTKSQKEDLKSRITQILDSTKHQTKKLTIQSAGTTFDTKYTGTANISEGPSFVKAEIEFVAPPYGKTLFPYTLYSSGLIDNTDGDAPVGPIFTIKGEVTNPGFTLGIDHYMWEGTVEDGMSLVIDFEKLTVYLKDNSGTKTNALSKFKGEFVKIGAGKSVVLVVDEGTEGHFTAEWSTPVLW